MAFLLALPYICSAVIGGTAVGTAVGAAVAISKNSTIKELQEKEYQIRLKLESSADHVQVIIDYVTIYIKQQQDGKEIGRVEEKKTFKGQLRAWNALQKSRRQLLAQSGYKQTQ